MSAWTNPPRSSSPLLTRISSQTPTGRSSTITTDLTILPFKTFTSNNYKQLGSILSSDTCKLEKISIGGRDLSVDNARVLGNGVNLNSIRSKSIKYVSVSKGPDDDITEEELNGNLKLSVLLCEITRDGGGSGIEEIDFSFKGLTTSIDKHPEHLTSISTSLSLLPSLTSLNFSRNNLSESGLSLLLSSLIASNVTTHLHLTDINLSETNITSNITLASLYAFIEKLSRNNLPLTLDLSNNNLLLATSLLDELPFDLFTNMFLCRVHTLNLSSTNIPTSYYVQLTKAISEVGLLRNINLSNSNLQPSFAPLLSNILISESVGIEVLNISSNSNITNEGYTVIISSLKSNEYSKLKSLDVSTNNLSPNNALNLLSLPNIEILRIYGNNLKGEGFVMLAIGMEALSLKLQTLDLSGNNSTPFGVHALLTSLPLTNITLRLLELGGNTIDQTDEDLLGAYSKERTWLDIARDVPERNSNSNLVSRASTEILPFPVGVGGSGGGTGGFRSGGVVSAEGLEEVLGKAGWKVGGMQENRGGGLSNNVYEEGEYEDVPVEIKGNGIRRGL